MSCCVRHRAQEAGFTLVEVLIAMFIFSLISVGTTTALSTSISGKQQVQIRLDELAELEAARALIKADMTNLILRPSREAYGNSELYVLSGGIDELIDFTRSGRDNPGGLARRSDLQRVQYVFEGGNLIRRAMGHENPAANTQVYERILMRDLQSVDVSFTKGSDTQSFIYLESGALDAKPDLVTLTTVLASGMRLTQHFEIGS